MLGKLGEILDLGELIRRIVKYVVEGIMVAIAAYAIPKRSMKIDSYCRYKFPTKFFAYFFPYFILFYSFNMVFQHRKIR